MNMNVHSSITHSLTCVFIHNNVLILFLKNKIDIQVSLGAHSSGLTFSSCKGEPNASINKLFIYEIR